MISRFEPAGDALPHVASQDPGDEGASLSPPEHDSQPAAQNATVANEERLRLAEAAGHIGTWEWDPLHETQTLSPELGRIFGVDIADPERSRKWAARVAPEDWPKVKNLMHEARQSGRMEFEYRYLHPDLGLRWLYCRGCRYHDESRMFGIVQDTTARKAAEETAQRFVAIVESSDDAIISKDLRGTVTSWNPGAERIFGFTAKEMIGRPITTIIPPELRDDETRILATITKGERIEHFETIRVKKNGDIVEVSLTVSPVKDEADQIIGAAKIARDITERKKAERSLLTSERLAAVGRLAATVAHEINNPLEAVTNLVYLAKTADNLREVREFLTSAEEQLAGVSHLTRQTLGFYRETSGARRFRTSDIVHSVISAFTARARNHSVELSSEIQEDPVIFAVPGEIRQVLANLICNSIDAIHGSGRVLVRVSAAHRACRQEAGVRIAIADTGSGIPASAFPRVFEPFFTTKRNVGTGLGLWVCKNIIATHNGTIRVRSCTTPGLSWTVFSVFLPLNLHKETSNSEPPHSESLLYTM